MSRIGFAFRHENQFVMAVILRKVSNDIFFKIEIKTFAGNNDCRLRNVSLACC